MDIPKGPWGISAIKFFKWSQYQISALIWPSKQFTLLKVHRYNVSYRWWNLDSKRSREEDWRQSAFEKSSELVVPGAFLPPALRKLLGPQFRTLSLDVTVTRLLLEAFSLFSHSTFFQLSWKTNLLEVCSENILLTLVKKLGYFWKLGKNISTAC